MKRVLASLVLASTVLLAGPVPSPQPAQAFAFWSSDPDVQARRDFETLMQAYRTTLAGGAEVGWSELADRFEPYASRYQGIWGLRSRLVWLDCLDRAGRGSQSAAGWKAIAEDRQAPEWALLATARALRTSNPELSKRTYLRLVQDHAHGPLLPEALLALGEMLLPTQPAEALAYLKQLLKVALGDPLVERATYLLGTEGSDEARRAYLRAYRANYPQGAYRYGVAKELSKLGGLTAGERVDLAGDLLEDAEYGPALRMVKGLTSPLALFRQGRATWRLGDAKGGEKLIRQAMAKDGGLRARGYIVLAQMAEQRKDAKTAATLYRQAAADQGEEGRDALDRLGKLYRKADDEANAVSIDQRLIARYGDSEEANEARWRFIWRSYQTGDLEAAKRWATSMGYEVLVKVEGPAGAYWLARFQERDGKYQAAASIYREVVRRSPRSYYGWRARYRLQAIEAGQDDPGFEVRPVDVELAADDLSPLLEAKAPKGDQMRTARYLSQAASFPASVKELLYLGQVEPALRLARKADMDDNLKSWLALQGGRYSEAIKFSEGTDPYLSYPLGFYPLMQAASELQGIDPLLLTSLVKQESLFDPKARSWVGAMGLAQLMPFTADWVGRKVPGPARSLTDPFWNLKLGAYYLGFVQKQLSNRPVFAVAAYNAGPNAVKKWIAKFGDQDVDVWVELIPFPETRHYVKKVFGNLWTYQMLYGKR
ncbi:MAG TPA: transglycosylase SLT domain-containing protein [Stenomitos sp.]